MTNWPWAEAGGFGPLLFGMGASTLAFIPTRYAVIGEGGSDTVMLPTLVRQASGAQYLTYQIAPGSAEASEKVISRLNLEGRRVAWLVDGDAGGAAKRSQLISAGIPENLIIVLGGSGSGLASEDLVAPDVYVAAVNEELRRSRGEGVAQLRVEDLGSTGRARSAEQWCTEQGLPFPNKGAVAHRVTDQRSDRSLVDPDHVDVARSLHEQIEDALSHGDGIEDS